MLLSVQTIFFRLHLAADNLFCTRCPTSGLGIGDDDDDDDDDDDNNSNNTFFMVLVFFFSFYSKAHRLRYTPCLASLAFSIQR